jgi:uncharacterized protein YukE
MIDSNDHVKNYRGLSESLKVVIAAMDRVTDRAQAHYDVGIPFQVNISPIRTSIEIIEAAASVMADRTQEIHISKENT